RLDLNGHLVRRTTNSAATNLKGGAHVVERLLEGCDSILTALGLDATEGAVNDGLSQRLLAVDENLVDKARDNRSAVYRVVDHGALGGGTLTRHLTQPFFAP